MFIAAAAHAATYSYADWSAQTQSSAGVPGTVTGTLIAPSGTISVTYTGDVASPTQINNTSVDYYSSWQSVYTNSVVSNSPGNVDLIVLSQNAAYTNTITFGSTVIDPIIDIVSLGQGGVGVSYNFDSTFTILSQGSAYWGGCSTCLVASGNTLTGLEGSGVVQFAGSFNSISWTSAGGEFWNGVTVGVADVASPEPSTWSLFALAGIAFAIASRKRARKSLEA